MIKIFKYFIQSLVIYLFFLIGFIMRLKISRKIFSNLFRLAGSFLKSNKLTESNIKIFSPNISQIEKKNNRILCGKIMEWYSLNIFF